MEIEKPLISSKQTRFCQSPTETCLLGRLLLSPACKDVTFCTASNYNKGADDMAKQVWSFVT